MLPRPARRRGELGAVHREPAHDRRALFDGDHEEGRLPLSECHVSTEGGIDDAARVRGVQVAQRGVRRTAGCHERPGPEDARAVGGDRREPAEVIVGECREDVGGGGVAQFRGELRSDDHALVGIECDTSFVDGERVQVEREDRFEVGVEVSACQ